MSKVKRIIEIEESDLERIREIVERENKTALSVTTRGTAYITIAESTLYNPSGDAISRESLLKSIREYAEPSSKLSDDFSRGITECACEVLDIIDNAPTIQAFTLEDMQNNYDAGVDSVIGKYDKAKGEWIFRKGVTCGGYYKCNKCGEVERAEKNYCPNCGALMKGGAE